VPLGRYILIDEEPPMETQLFIYVSLELIFHDIPGGTLVPLNVTLYVTGNFTVMHSDLPRNENSLSENEIVVKPVLYEGVYSYVPF
jgi:hypothetical protein